MCAIDDSLQMGNSNKIDSVLAAVVVAGICSMTAALILFIFRPPSFPKIVTFSQVAVGIAFAFGPSIQAISKTTRILTRYAGIALIVGSIFGVFGTRIGTVVVIVRSACVFTLLCVSALAIRTLVNLPAGKDGQ